MFCVCLLTKRGLVYCYHNGVSNPIPPPSSRTLTTVFLDRDGVVNEKMPEGHYVTRWSEFRLLPGVPDAIGRLNRAGLRVVVVSNQRGIALGFYTAADVEAIHSTLQKVLAAQDAHVDAFFYCPHDKKQCNCRKPLPGLFEQAVAAFPEIQAASSVMIGDSLSDIEFGRRLGIRTIFIEGDPERRKPGSEAAIELAGEHFIDLPEAVEHLLADRQHAKQKPRYSPIASSVA
jgi:D-glycero-D-manno-heptose 1,7-bisphosphate phosphatase